MKSWLLFILISAGVSAQAQIGIGLGTGGVGVGFNVGTGNRTRPAKSAEGEIRYLKDQLNLSDGQVVAVREAIRDREKYRSHREKMDNGQRFEQDMKDILSPEQHAKYLEIRQQRTNSRTKSKPRRQEVPASEWDDVYR